LPKSVQGLPTEGAFDLLVFLRKEELAKGNFLGLLHVLVGRRVEDQHGRLISPGLTWRAAAQLLKKLRWKKEAVRELHLDPKALPPRDRERFWYMTISRAGIDSAEARAAGDRLAQALRRLGYRVD
jgi:hypothetical protein